MNTGKPVHYSGLYFTEPVILNGNTTFYDPRGNAEEGHIGNGVIKITKIGEYITDYVDYFNNHLIMSPFIFICFE